MNEPTAADVARARRKVLYAAGLAVGAVIGFYSGVNLVIPLLATGAVWWLAVKALPSAKQFLVPCVAVQAGHLLWLCFGFAYLGILNANLIDVVVVAAGLAWLVLRPGSVPVMVLMALQAWGLAINVAALVPAATGSAVHQALVVHVAWRILALVFLTQLFKRLRAASEGDSAGAGH
jgi:hypothetical protein